MRLAEEVDATVAIAAATIRLLVRRSCWLRWAAAVAGILPVTSALTRLAYRIRALLSGAQGCLRYLSHWIERLNLPCCR